jgi:hypothetical protein
MAERIPSPLARYVRRIERRWAAIQERPIVLSPREWTLVAAWHERGIPLALVGQAMDDAVERSRSRRGGRLPRRVTYLAPAVEEAWSAVVDGRLCGARPDPPPARPATSDTWRLRALDPSSGPALRELIGELLRRLAAGEAADELDRELDRRLAETAPADLLAAVEAGIEADLEAYRDRMSEERLGHTRSRARTARLREALGLPHL